MKTTMGMRSLVSVCIALVVPLLMVSPARADTTCTGDYCVITGGPITTPVGQVTVIVTSKNVVTVSLVPSVRAVAVFGVPVSIPPGPPGIPGHARTIVVTPAGTINIDTVIIPPGPPGRRSFPDVAVISIQHPPNPCRARTNGYTVTFTPILPPGPPN